MKNIKNEQIDLSAIPTCDMSGATFSVSQDFDKGKIIENQNASDVSKPKIKVYHPKMMIAYKSYLNSSQ